MSVFRTVRTGLASPDASTRRHGPRPGDDSDRPRSVKTVTSDDLASMAIAAAAGLSLSLGLRTALGWDSIMGTAIWAYLGFLGAYYVLTQDRHGRVIAADRFVTVLIWSAGAAVVAVLAYMLGFLIVKGVHGLWVNRSTFFTQDASQVDPLKPGSGITHAIIGTVEQVGIALVVVVPVAILTSVYLHEIRGRAAPLIRFIVDAMSGLPSIVAGLLVYTVVVIGHGFSGVAAAMALIVLMLPTVTRASEEILRTVPDGLRESSLALGAPQWRVIVRVVLPTARAGLITAAILGVARAIGETAPVLLTAFGSRFMNLNPLDGPQGNLPLYIWEFIRQPNANQQDRAWAAMLVLVVIVLVLFVLARYIGARSERRLRRSR